MEQPGPYIVEPKIQHTQTFILLHGLGSNGQKFGTEFLATGVTSKGHNLSDIFPGARFIFPTAKKRRSSAFRRALINPWFDIASLEDPSYKKEKQYDGLADSGNYITSLIQEEMKIIPPDRIVLGGLSHGCAMGLSLLLCTNQPLAAFIGISGWLPFQDDLEEILHSNHIEADNQNDFFGTTGEIDEPQRDFVSEALQFQREVLSLNVELISAAKSVLSTPVFIGHGESDEKIKFALGEKLVGTLQGMGMDITFEKYPELGHCYKVPEEFDDILAFLKAKTRL